MAGTRISGLFSGMDTESLIKDLMEAKKTKVNNKKKDQIALQYKQDKWKELNTKLKNLQSKYVSNMRFTTSYAKKTTTVSNSSAVSVITGEGAVDGVQEMEVKQMAKTGYLTGAKLGDGNQDYTALTTMKDLGFTGTGKIQIASGDKEVSLEITEETTISDVLNGLKNAGINANFDAKNQRFFVSSKQSGTEHDFSIAAINEDGQKALQALGLKVGIQEDAATRAYYEKWAALKDAGAEDAVMKAEIEKIAAQKKEEFKAKRETLSNTKKEAEDAIASLEKEYGEKYKDEPLKTAAEYEDRIADLKIKLDDDTNTEEDKARINEELEKAEAAKKDAEALEKEQKKKADAEAELAEIEASYDAENDKLTEKATEEIYQELHEKAVNVAAALEAELKNPAAGTGATKVNAQNAVIELNGATFENNTNVFEINGLTITALSPTKAGEKVTITTQNDVSGIYDMVKNFLKEYNSIINEIDKLYNAASTGRLKPMTSEEKDAVSETEAKDWETKLRDSILRRDSNLSTIGDTLKEAMRTSFTVGGKSMSLRDFGIDTLSYFTAAENEKYALHIDGDPDDASTSGNADKLKSLISSDPDTVVDFFSQLGKNLYTKMSELSKSVEGYRSFGNFFDDKKLKSDYDDYTSKISDMESKLNDYEDKWYAKFSKMETAMAKMQSNASAVTSMLGGGQ